VQATKVQLRAARPVPKAWDTYNQTHAHQDGPISFIPATALRRPLRVVCGFYANIWELEALLLWRTSVASTADLGEAFGLLRRAKEAREIAATIKVD
jgi:hypothetical protein